MLILPHISEKAQLSLDFFDSLKPPLHSERGLPLYSLRTPEFELRSGGKLDAGSAGIKLDQPQILILYAKKENFRATPHK